MCVGHYLMCLQRIPLMVFLNGLVVISSEFSNVIVWFVSVWQECSDKAELSLFENKTAFCCSFKQCATVAPDQRH